MPDWRIIRVSHAVGGSTSLPHQANAVELAPSTAYFAVRHNATTISVLLHKIYKNDSIFTCSNRYRLSYSQLARK